MARGVARGIATRAGSHTRRARHVARAEAAVLRMVTFRAKRTASVMVPQSPDSVARGASLTDFLASPACHQVHGHHLCMPLLRRKTFRPAGCPAPMTGKTGLERWKGTLHSAVYAWWLGAPPCGQLNEAEAEDTPGDWGSAGGDWQGVYGGTGPAQGLARRCTRVGTDEERTETQHPLPRPPPQVEQRPLARDVDTGSVHSDVGLLAVQALLDAPYSYAMEGEEAATYKCQAGWEAAVMGFKLSPAMTVRIQPQGDWELADEGCLRVDVVGTEFHGAGEESLNELTDLTSSNTVRWRDMSSEGQHAMQVRPCQHPSCPSLGWKWRAQVASQSS